MHIGMSMAVKLERINIRIRPDVKRDAFTLAELRRCDLTELLTELIVSETDRERVARPDMFADAAKRVAKSKEKPKSRHNRPASKAANR